MGESGFLVTDGADVDLPSVVALYLAVGWTAYAADPQTLQAALRGSSRVVVAREGAALVGLARVVSDGASIAYLQDVLVHPAHRRAGVGRALVEAALEPFSHVRQKVLLTDEEPGQAAFYRGLGYEEAGEHPAGPLRAFVRFDA